MFLKYDNIAWNEPIRKVSGLISDTKAKSSRGSENYPRHEKIDTEETYDIWNEPLDMSDMESVIWYFFFTSNDCTIKSVLDTGVAILAEVQCHKKCLFGSAWMAIVDPVIVGKSVKWIAQWKVSVQMIG